MLHLTKLMHCLETNDYDLKPLENNDKITNFSRYTMTTPCSMLYEFQYVLKHDKLEEIEKFLNNNKESLEAKNAKGKTPLIFVAEVGRYNAVELLLNRGANIEATNNNGHTPLIVAAENGHKNTVELLLNRGANIDATNNNGHKNIVELLLNRGANIEATKNNGHTPLIGATTHGHKHIQQILKANAIKQGAILNAVNNNGKTPLDLAQGSTKNSIRGIKYKLNYILPIIAIFGFTASMITGIATGMYSYLNFKNFKLLLNSNIQYIMGALLGLSVLSVILMPKFGIIKLPKCWTPVPEKTNVAETGKSPTPN